jgi:hypothetical protein
VVLLSCQGAAGWQQQPLLVWQQQVLRGWLLLGLLLLLRLGCCTLKGLSPLAACSYTCRAAAAAVTAAVARQRCSNVLASDEGIRHDRPAWQQQDEMHAGAKG